MYVYSYIPCAYFHTHALIHTDASALVRSTAVDMLQHFAAPSRRLPPSDLELVYARTRDVASSVRLQAAAVLTKAIEWMRLVQDDMVRGTEDIQASALHCMHASTQHKPCCVWVMSACAYAHIYKSLYTCMHACVAVLI
jgi:hypothetical protein